MTSEVRRKKVKRQRKAPGAPKRGKSPYILFSMGVREEVKKTLPPDAKVTDIVRAVARAWNQQSAEQRQPWIEAAAKDKQRYEAEMATYDGPLRVPVKPVSPVGHSNSINPRQLIAPRRPTTAFQFYCKAMRHQMKSNPYHELYYVESTDLPTHLDRMWRGLTEAQQHPYITKEIADHRRYESEIATFQSIHSNWTSNLQDPSAIPYGLVHETRAGPTTGTPCYCSTQPNKQWETNVLQADNLTLPGLYEPEYSGESPLYAILNHSIGNILHSQ